jgi:hypothetical protein
MEARSFAWLPPVQGGSRRHSQPPVPYCVAGDARACVKSYDVYMSIPNTLLSIHDKLELHASLRRRTGGPAGAIVGLIRTPITHCQRGTWRVSLSSE